MKNRIKEKYENGESTIGTFLNLGSGVAAECVGISGMDYFIIDTEHGSFGLDGIVDCIRSAEIKGITPFVRVPEIGREKILKALDAGAQGIIIPGIRSLEEVKKVISYGKYCPDGERGFCPTRCCDFGYTGALSEGIKPFLENCNAETMLIPQCETVECLEIIEDVVQLPGVDGIFIGPFDLSVAMGIPADFDNEKFKSAIEHVMNVCKKNHKPVFIFAPNVDMAKLRLSQGYDSVTINGDLNVLVESYLNMVNTIKQ